MGWHAGDWLAAVVSNSVVESGGQEREPEQVGRVAWGHVT